MPRSEVPLPALCRTSPRPAATALLYAAVALLGVAGLWRWLRRLWLRRRALSVPGRRTTQVLEIPAELTLTADHGLVLRTSAQATASDLDRFWQLTLDPGRDLITYRPLGQQQTLRQIHARVRAQSQQQSMKKGLAFFIFDGDLVVGSIGFSRLDAMTSSGELDLILSRSHWDDGHASHLHLAILDYGFQNLHLQRVLCGVDRANRVVRAFYEGLHWDLVSVGRAGSPNLYNYVICRQKYLDETRSALMTTSAAKRAEGTTPSPDLDPVRA